MVSEEPPVIRSSAEALSARSEAIARVDSNADPEWKARAAGAVADVCERYDEFTADTIWLYLDQPPTPAALGPVMLRAARAGLCEKTGRMKMTENPVRHRDLTVWRSLVRG